MEHDSEGSRKPVGLLRSCLLWLFNQFISHFIDLTNISKHLSVRAGTIRRMQQSDNVDRFRINYVEANRSGGG